MAERFKKLYDLPSNLYSEGAPVIIRAGSLLKDTETGKVIAQIKYHSVSNIPIKALKIKVAAFDISGSELEGIDEYQYLDLNIQNGQDFGSNKAVVLPNDITRSFGITSVIAILSNGTTLHATMPMKALPVPATLLSVLKSNELVKQYQIETSDKAVYVPIKEVGLWRCTCGEWNSNDNCTLCGLNFPTASKFLDSSLLEPKAEERIVQEKLYQEQQKRVAEEQEKVAKETARKQKKKNTILVCGAILAVVIISVLSFYSYQHRYDEIAGIYALQNLEKAEEALYKFEQDSIDEYGFNPYSYEIRITGSGKVYGLSFVNDRGSLTPRAATVKKVSDTGVIEFDVLDYPNAKVSLAVNTKTGEATYSSRSLKLDYQRITEELAKNGYKECSAEDVRKELSFIQGLFELESVAAISDKYPDATTENAKDDLRLDGSFCGANGAYQIWELDNVYRIIFEQGIYDTNTEKEDLIDAISSVLGEPYYYKDSKENFEVYTWKSSEFNLKIDYWPHEGIYFFLDKTNTESSERETEDSSTESDAKDIDSSSDNDAGVVDSFISNGCFKFDPRSFIKRFDDADKTASGYNYTYMRMNGEASLFYELAEISGGYENVKSVGMISFVKGTDTTLAIEEDYTENIITRINVLVKDIDYVPSILVSCMCAADPALDFTAAYNVGLEVMEEAGTENGYTYNGVNYVIATDGEYYYIIISVERDSVLGEGTGENTDIQKNEENTDANENQDNTNIQEDEDDTDANENHDNNDVNKNQNNTDLGGVSKLTVSSTDVSLGNSSQIINITVPDSYNGEVYYYIANGEILSAFWGGWSGYTITLTLIPKSIGSTSVEIYLDNGDSVMVDVTVTVADYSPNAADYTTLRIAPETYYTFNDDVGCSSDAVLLESADYTISDNGDGTVNIAISGTMQRKTDNISTYVQIGYHLYVNGENIISGTVGTDAPGLNQSYSYTLELCGLQPGNYIIYFTNC